MITALDKEVFDIIILISSNKRETMTNALLSSLSDFLSKKVNHHSLSAYHVLGTVLTLSHMIITTAPSTSYFTDKESGAQRD